MRLPLLLVAALVLAGCAGNAAPSTETQQPTTTTQSTTATTSTTSQPPSSSPKVMVIQGLVVDEGVRPLAGATVTILELNRTQVTGAGGTFRFEGLVPTTYFVRATAPEYSTQTLSIDPVRAEEVLKFQLTATPRSLAYNQTFHFQGHIQCALEVLIISPSCDSLLTDPRVGGPALFNDTSVTYVPVLQGWQTIVVDVVFNPEEQPLLDGIRLTVRGSYDSENFGTYQQYGRFFSPEPFTFRIEPNGTYDKGDAPVPANTTQFQFNAYPHSKGYHTVCAPAPASLCLLGVGTGLDVSFDLYLTVFYVEAAPEGWTLRV
jgi:hypothetical protein